MNVAAIALLAALPLAAVRRAPDCSSNVCVETRRTGEGVSFIVSNERKTSVWIELSFGEGVNLFAPDVVQQLVGPGSSEVIATVTRRDPAQPYRYQYRWTWSAGDPRAVHDDAYVYRVPVGDSNELRAHPPRSSRPLFPVHAGDAIHVARDGRVVEARRVGSATNGAHIVTLLHSDGTYADYRFGGQLTQPEGATLRRGETVGVADRDAAVELIVWRARRRGGREPLRFRIGDGTRTGCFLGGP